ncbi:MAG TPA: ABC transporter substrate-binding protein [Sinorhizobium sp.]|nr:ABC transporter substrate-binding protein [Sinorhizobium sp.]
MRPRASFAGALTLLLALLLCAVARAQAQWPMTVTDAAGRQVEIPGKPAAVLLGSGFNLIALSLIHPDPVSLLAGWSGDMKDYSPEIYASFVRKFPRLAEVPLIDDGSGPGLSFEAILTVKADLAILADWQADTEAGRRAIEYLESTGVPVVVVDFNNQLLSNTPRNMRLLGKIFEREEQAEAFARFYEDRLSRIRDRVARHPLPGPKVLMEAFPTADRCCWAFGVAGLGELISITGSRNIAEGKLPQPGGMMNAEAVMAENPDVYIATSSPGGKHSGFSIGPGVKPEEATRTLAEMVGRPIMASLAAVRNGRVHGLWNFFNAVPLNIVAADAFASWLRPDLFPDVDPVETLAEINRRFAAVPFEGSYWISVNGR